MIISRVSEVQVYLIYSPTDSIYFTQEYLCTSQVSLSLSLAPRQAYFQSPANISASCYPSMIYLFILLVILSHSWTSFEFYSCKTTGIWITSWWSVDALPDTKCCVLSSSFLCRTPLLFLQYLILYILILNFYFLLLCSNSWSIFREFVTQKAMEIFLCSTPAFYLWYCKWQTCSCYWS